MFASYVKTSSVRRQGTLSLIVAMAFAYFSTTACASSAANAGPPYWNTTGTVTHVLQNDKYDVGSDIIDEVHFITSLNTRVRILASGQVHVAAPSGTTTSSGVGQSATMQVQGGDKASFAGYAVHTGDWGTNIQSYVTRPNTKAYAVTLNGVDKFYVAGGGWLYANGAWFGSDRNLKSEIHGISQALEKVMGLQGVTFEWKEEARSSASSPELEHRTEMGLIAQDVEKVVPE
ncbi:MAG: tail fiber domain-containing protein, partial [Candidatus Methylomirabilaceae bacterium]